MEPFGFRDRCLSDGHLIAMATGPGLLLGAGPGWTTRPGDLRRSITAVGFPTAAIGAGPLVQSSASDGVRIMRLPSWVGLVEQDGASESPSASDLVAAVAGSPWVGVSRFIRGITDTMAGMSARTTFVT